MRLRSFLFILCANFLLPAISHADWHLQWQRQLPPRKPAWEFTARMPMDVGYQPTIVRDLVVIGCEHDGSLGAYDLATGKQRWQFFTNGPIRVQPVADGKRIYAGSDDGYLYCLDTGGKLLWKVRGGPSERKVLGHGRIMSAWPISARPVLHDGKLYFVAGYWPLDGIFVYAVDAESGKTHWTNSTTQFRPFGDMRIHEGKLYIRGHHGNGILDAKTGEAFKEKMPRFAVEIPKFDTPGVRGSVTGRFAGQGHVIVCTKEGGIWCFGKKKVEAKQQLLSKTLTKTEKADSLPAELVKQLPEEGYCLVAGLTNGAAIDTLMQKSKLYVVALDSDAAIVAKIRDRCARKGYFDNGRLQVLQGSPQDCELPPYFANVVFSEKKENLPKSIRECVRPYDGMLVEVNGDRFTMRKRAKLPGAADWGHETADPANSLASKETRIKAPLGLLWYGGEAAAPRFYYDGNVDHQSGHGLNPQPAGAQIVDGRMFLQGPGLMGAVDIYTGRILWETKLPRAYTFGGSGGGLGKHSRKHPHPWKYPPALEFEVKPTQHSRASGFNFATVSDGIYIGAAENLLRLRPSDGKLISSWQVPLKEKGLCWGRLRIVDDLVISTVFRPQDLADAQAGFDGNGGATHAYDIFFHPTAKDAVYANDDLVAFFQRT